MTDTIHAPTRATPLVLATDLDGTFAGGTATHRTRLQNLLTELSGTTLIYVTGRSIDATRALIMEADLPIPDVLIADVGTTVVHGPDFESVGAIEAAIARDWPGGDAVRDRLRGLHMISEQDIRAPRRVSYSLTEGSMDDALAFARDRLEGMAVDLIGSAGVYIDVLPRGANKGTTLRSVVRWLGRTEAGVVVAGDTLNDLALFETGYNGIVVGNCEAGLLDRIRGMDHVYVARGHGAAGILEGLGHYGWTTEVIDGE